MFGYVTPLNPELKVKEHLFYKSVYCGLCKCMGKSVCSSSRLTLSYDFVFLTLIRASLTNDKFEVYNSTCGVHPFKKRPMIRSNASMVYSSKAGAIMAYFKILDDANDSKGFKRLASKLLLPAANKMKRKADLPEFCERVKELTQRLSDLETQGSASIDGAAQSFGETLKTIFSFGLEKDSPEYRISEECGFHMGKWIYLLDAIDDYGDDLKSGSYNPIICAAKEELLIDSLPQKYQELPKQIRERIECSLLLELSRIESAVNLIDFKDDGVKNVVMNIIHLGMVSRQKKVTDGTESNKNGEFYQNV